jgi:hypothetical protein
MERRPPTQMCGVLLLTPSMQIEGQMEIVGAPLAFLNAEERDGLILHQAHILPLPAGGRLREWTQSSLTLRRQEIVLLYLTDPAVQAAVQTLTRSEQYICYTSLAVVRADFHMPAEALRYDFLAALSGDLIPATDAQAFPLIPTPLPFPERCDLLLVGRSHIQMYHPT